MELSTLRVNPPSVWNEPSARRVVSELTRDPDHLVRKALSFQTLRSSTPCLVCRRRIKLNGFLAGHRIDLTRPASCRIYRLGIPP